MPLDPLIQKLLEAAAREPPLENLTPVDTRRRIKQRIAAIPVTTAVIAGAEDMSFELPGRCIRGRLYRPYVTATPYLVMFFHGGGWSVCDLDTHDNLCRRICADAGAAVVSVDYRLAPEHRYPAAFDDCYDVTQRVLAQAQGYGVDATRFVLSGDSAGGNLAAAVALALRDRGVRQADGLALIYPGLRDPALGGASYDAFGEGFWLSRADALRSWRNYFQGQGEIPAYAAPLHADRFDNLPPTLVITAEYDILRDEGEAFATRLNEAGVEARVIRYPGVTHGFVALEPILRVADGACGDLGAWIRRTLRA